jgi:alpha-beta hydrolase superfamily lysophospholipase
MKRPEGTNLDFEACLGDVEQGLKTLHKAYPKLPIFLVGESMGGAIAIQAASRYPQLLAGLVSAVPSSEARSDSAKSVMVVAYQSVKHPRAKIDMTTVIVDGVTNDQALRRKIDDNPLNRMELSKKQLVQFKKFMDETHAAAPLVERTPVLMLVAYKDRLVTTQGSVDLFSEMTTPQKLMIGDGHSQHLMLEEAQMTPEIERILKGWLREKAAQPLSGGASTR